MTQEEDEYLVRLFESPRDALAASSTLEDALIFLEEVRWPRGIRCPECDSSNVAIPESDAYRANRRRRCRACERSFSPTSGTPLDSQRSPRTTLVFAIALSAEFIGSELSDRIEEATDLKTAAAKSLALSVVSWQYRAEGAVEDSGVDTDRPVPAPETVEVVRVVNRYRMPGLAVCVLAGLVWWVLWSTGALEKRLIERWTSGNAPQVYETVRLKDELRQDWVRRHSNLYLEAIRQLPPDKPE